MSTVFDILNLEFALTESMLYLPTGGQRSLDSGTVCTNGEATETISFPLHKLSYGWVFRLQGIMLSGGRQLGPAW